MNPVLAELLWFFKVAIVVVPAGHWLSKQVSRIVYAVGVIPELKRMSRLHSKQITELAIAGKNVATIAFFPTQRLSKEEHLQAIEKFDRILELRYSDPDSPFKR